MPNSTDDFTKYYTVVLFSPLLNTDCFRATVNASSCEKKICRHVFYSLLTSCINDTNLIVKVFVSDESDHSSSVGKMLNYYL